MRTPTVTAGEGPAADIIAPSIGRISHKVSAHSLSTDSIGDLAAIQVSVRQGDPFHEIPVYAGISCGSPALQIESQWLKLHAWQVLLRLTFTNAELDPDSIRTLVRQPGQSASSGRSDLHTRTITQHQMKLGGQAGIRRGRLSAVLSIVLNRETGTSVSRTAIETETHVREIIMIGAFGADTIAFGDADYGDTYHEHGFLKNSYPRPDEGRDEPLFKLRPIDPTKPVQLTLFTAVQFSRLHVEMDNPDRHMRELALNEAGRRGDDIVETLRQQMCGDEIAARVEKNQRAIGLPQREGEFIAAIEVMDIHPVGRQDGPS